MTILIKHDARKIEKVTVKELRRKLRKTIDRILGSENEEDNIVI